MDTNMVLNSSFNELVFENRHKNYGAYQIRKRYRKNVWLSVGVAVTFFSSCLLLYMGNMPNAVAAVIPKSDSTVKIIPYIVDPPIKPAEIIKPQTSTPPKGIDSHDPTTPIVSKDSVKIINPADTVTSSKGKIGGTGPIGPIGDPPCINCDTTHHKKVITISDTFIAGKSPLDPGIDEFFRKNIHYPEMAKDGGIQGTVWLSFIINSKGEIHDLKIIKSAHPWLDREVLRVASVMPKWIPVKDADESVEFIYRKPVRFTLN
jgi:protein TonB